MGTDLTTHDDARPDYRRDRWGRALIQGKPYTRSSSAVKVLADTWNLEAWQRRNLAYGLAKDASLVARVLALGGDPTTWGRAEKAKIQEVIDDANKIAQSHKRADIGTALHRMMELVDAGQDVDGGPYQADIDAYVAARDAMGLVPIPQYLECKMVCHALELAGSVDNIYAHDGGHVIGDKKTGTSVDFAVLEHAGQLAGYAHGELWDVVADAPLPTPEIRTDVGYIIHVPAGEGRCEIHALDLKAGYRAAELAIAVRSIRKEAKSWSVKVDLSTLAPTVPLPVVEQTPEPVAALPGSGENAPSGSSLPLDGGQSAGSSQESDPALELANSIAGWGSQLKALLAVEWPSGVPTPGKVRKGEATWTPEQLERARAAVNEIIGPFDDPPTEPRPLRSSTPPEDYVTPIDDGPPVADDVLDELLAAIKGSPVRSIVNGWLSEASAAGVSWQPRLNKRTRQVGIARAAYWLARIIEDAPEDADDATFVDLVRAILAASMASNDALMGVNPIGVVLARLTIDEAARVADFSQSVIDHGFTFSERGVIVLPDTAAPAA